MVQHGWPGGQPSIYEHRGFIAGAGCHQRMLWQLWTAGSPSTHNVPFMDARSPGRPCYISKLTVHTHGCSTWNRCKYPRWFSTAGREASPPYTYLVGVCRAGAPPLEGRSPGRPCYINKLTIHIHRCSTWNRCKYPRWLSTAGREASPPVTDTGGLIAWAVRHQRTMCHLWRAGLLAGRVT